MQIVHMKTIDLFSGCGGMSLGFQNMGFDIVAAYDNWEPAIEVYKRNFTHPILRRDLSDDKVIQEIVDLSPEIIIGGPPCQDFSSAGYRNENLGRAVLTVAYSNIIKLARPNFFVMENVPQVRNSEAYKQAVQNFKEAGYGLTQVILDARYCGVPQSRKRCFLIGKLCEKDGFMEKYIKENLSEKPLTIYDYLGDSLGVEYYFRIPRSYSRRAVFSIYEPCQTIRGVDRPIPKTYKKHVDDLVEIGPKVRALTVLERSYIQTFPKDFIFEGTKTNLNQMIGNAVPVKLAEFVAKAILQYSCDCGGEGY